MTSTNAADIVVTGGLVVTGDGIARVDVIVNDGVVTDLVQDASAVHAARVIKADGRYVLPGAIDAHCHPVNSDKMDAMSLTAALGGITTLIPFIGNVRAWGWTGDTRDIVQRFIDEAVAGPGSVGRRRTVPIWVSLR